MRTLRSFLFVPGDSERKLAKAQSTQADALILDLEDAVAPASKDSARRMVRSYLLERPIPRVGPQLWVRINPLDTDLALLDLAGVVSCQPDGLMLPKTNGPKDVQQLSHYLDALEAQAGLELGRIQILPVATETALAPFQLGNYATAGLKRLYGLTWGAEDLSTALGASTNLDAGGDWALTYRLVRSMTLMAAKAAGVAAIETLYVDLADEEGLRHSSRISRSEGFTGRIAIHPAQVPAINESYLPSEKEVAEARRVVEAFQAASGAGTISLDGRMLDIPHLRQARAILNLTS